MAELRAEADDPVTYSEGEAFKTRIYSLIKEDRELTEMAVAIFEVNALKPREIAEVCMTTATDIQNRKKRFGRLLQDHGHCQKESEACMKRKKTSDEARKAFQAMYNAFVPPIEEIDDSEVVDLLLSSGIDPDSLTTKAHDHLQKIAGERYLSRGESVPAELKNALQQLKPTSMTEEIAKESEKARSTIRSMFENAVNIIGPIELGRGPCLEPAFRNKTELTETDKKKLTRLQEELDSGGDHPRRRNQGEYL